MTKTQQLHQIASKYNRWSSDNSKINNKTLVEYILIHGNSQELFFIFKFFRDLINEKWTIIQKNIYISAKRKKVLETLFNIKKEKWA